MQREFGNTLASVELDSLEKSVNQLIQFYDKNKQLISGSSKERDIGYMRSYSELSGSFREYFLALRDYEKYEVEYNSVKRQLLDQAVVDVDTETTISEESFLEYMSQFQGVVLTNVDLTIEEDSYHAENVLIAGRRFSFDLLPGKRNEIRNIQIDGEDSRVSYALDDEEEALADLFAQAKQEERDRYDFRNFFLNTFIYKGGDTTREIVQDELPEDQEDKVIIAIKNDKLLGTRGEFASIKNLLQIEYDDLDVLIKEGGYQIHIEDAFLELSPESDSS
ncbi:MAG: hypothetical protein H6767_08825 [Candidatus Peribacteria bacterium]|nr:MAG: hypothetical protein H6767_08825 [Candidatus Peribacteria bacterium]